VSCWGGGLLVGAGGDGLAALVDRGLLRGRGGGVGELGGVGVGAGGGLDRVGPGAGAGREDRRPQGGVDGDVDERQRLAGGEGGDGGGGPVAEHAVGGARGQAGAAQLGLQAGDVVASGADGERAVEGRDGAAGFVEGEVVVRVGHGPRG
jgi:hypothetical protein